MDKAKDKGKGKGKKKFKLDIKDPNVRNVLIAVGVLGLAGYLWVEQVYTPMTANIAELTEKKEKLDAELVRINALKPQLEKLRKEAILLAAQLDSLRNIFPDEKEVAKLIRQITTVNRKSSIMTTKFIPMPDVVQEYYIENKYNVSVSGDYHNIGAFFSYLANFQLIINLTNVVINANPGYKKFVYDEGLMPERTPSVMANFEMTTFSSRK